MKKYLSLLIALSMVLTSFSVFATSENNYVLTPDEGEVPYPPEVTVNSQVVVTPLPVDEKNITLEETEKNKIWEKYGYTKSEFDAFPSALREAMLFTPEEIGKSFEVPTKEDFARWEAKEKAEQLRISSDTSTTNTRSTANEVRNAVGEFIQEKTYTCGPASARNAINGYLWHHYTKYGNAIPSEPWWGVVPSESRLGNWDNLQTEHYEQTPFATRWEQVMNYFVPNRPTGYTLQWGFDGWESSFWTKVKTTLNLSGNYNVIGNLFGTITSANQINSEYPIGGSYMHYICIFGYDPDDSTVFIEDSHYAHSIHMFRVAYTKAAKACKQRGIIW